MLLLVLGALVALTACTGGGEGSDETWREPHVEPGLAERLEAERQARVEQRQAAEAEAEAGLERIDIRPGDNAAEVVTGAPAGAHFHFVSGVHRGVSVMARDGDRFTADRDAVLSGAVVLESFVATDGVWATTSQRGPAAPAGECRPTTPLCGHPEELFVDGQPVARVLDRSEVGPGSWMLDGEREEVVLGDDPAGRLVELSTSWFGLAGEAEGVVIDGLHFERYANPAQAGVVHMSTGAEGWTITDCKVTQAHGVGVFLTASATVSGCVLTDNGQMGLTGSGNGIVVQENVIARNNRLGFDPGWAAGGAKFAYATNLRVVDNVVFENDGAGLWTDLDCVDVLYEGNEVIDNTGAGIFHEISYAAEIRGNTVMGNGEDSPGWVWGAGIQIAGSSDVVVVDNVVEANRHAIIGVEQDRGSGAFGEYELARISVLQNTIRDSGQTGIAQDRGAPQVYERDHVFDENSYSGRVGWSWQGGEQSWRDWQGLGHEPAGSFRPS